ncbi:hypothetical protein D3C73_185330 [compost metagenome]
MDKSHVDKWREMKKNLPLKSFILTFNLINGDEIKVKTEVKDDFDIKIRLDKQRFDFARNDFNQSVSIYRDHVVWVGIEEV